MRLHDRTRFLALVALLIFAAALPAAEKAPAKLSKEEQGKKHAAERKAGLELFKKHVGGILKNKCLQCHGGKTVESDLNLATREGLLRGGAAGQVVELGDAKGSWLYKLITGEEEPIMPYEGDKLSQAEIGHLAKWIDLGAPYDKPLIEQHADKDWKDKTVPAEAQNFWSFQPLADVQPPAVQQADWCQTPVDRFILARQEAKGLAPNPAVSRPQFIRRAYFDLIGLPPTPEEISAFEQDRSPAAYEKLIDRLLASPHYGERWARHWLDVARFAESHGFEQDYNREYAYHFRDFVIKAFNQDMPFDQFVRWQLAGDEFAPGDPLALAATGFLGAGVFPTQITANEVERTRYDALDDMAATTGTAMLGLTIGCARCHDHKYDPIPQADYYRLLSTFTTTVRTNQDVKLDAAGYRQAKATFEKEHAPLVAARDEYERKQLPAKFQSWEKSRGNKLPPWQVLDFEQAKSHGGAKLEAQPDGSLLATGKNPNNDTYTLIAHTQQSDIQAIRLEALSHPSLKKGGPGRAGNGNFALTDFRVTAASLKGDGKTKPVTVTLKHPRTTFEQKGLLAAHTIDGNKKSGWAVDPQFGKDHAVVYDVEGSLGFEAGTKLTFTLEFKNNKQHSIGRPRLSISTRKDAGLKEDSIPEAVARLLTVPAQDRTAEQTQTLHDWYRHRDDGWQKLQADVEQHLGKAPQPQTTKMMLCSEGLKPIRHHTQGKDFFEETYFLRRGDCEQKDGVAKQSFLQVLMRHPDGAAHWQEKAPEGWRTSYRRRALANWITDTEHGPGHLLARVIVNRLWQHHFGRGLVATPNDFGSQGERPTHPELLEWLAAELIREGWRLKPLHKTIMLSAVYAESTDFVEAKSKIDPENRLLWRRSPQRLEAEVIRDAMLAISGQLDTKMFGPGTLHEGHTRRSIYFTIKRSKLIPMMQLFDAPEPLVSVGRRPSTTIAPQALLFMNNEHIRKWAESFARRLEKEAGDSPEAIIRRGYLVAVGREPTEQELSDGVAFLEGQVKSYREANKPSPNQLARNDFAQVLFCLNEFVYPE